MMVLVIVGVNMFIIVYENGVSYCECEYGDFFCMDMVMNMIVNLNILTFIIVDVIRVFIIVDVNMVMIMIKITGS